MPSEHHQSRLKAGHEGMVLIPVELNAALGRSTCKSPPEVDGIWGSPGIHFAGNSYLIGYRYMLNLTNATDRSGFVIKLGFSSWPL